MSKQLVVTIRGVDALTGPAKQAAASVVTIAQTSEDTEKRSRGAFSRMVGGITSLKSIAVAAAGAIGGAFVTRRAFGWLESAAGDLDKLVKASRRLDIPVEALSSMKHVAEASGSSFEAMLDSFSKAQRGMGEFAATGGGKASEAFKLLGVSMRDASGRTRQFADVLPELADAINAIPDANRRGWLIAKIFGEGPEAANLLAEGGARLRAMSAEARALGTIFTPEQAAIGERFRDSIDRVGAAWLGLKVRVLEQVGPWMTEAMNRVAEFVAAVPRMVGSAVATVRSALGGDENARAVISGFFESLGRLARVGIEGVGRVAVAMVVDVAGLVGDFFADTVRRKVSAFFDQIPLEIRARSVEARLAVAEFFGYDEMVQGQVESLKGIYAEMDALGKYAGRTAVEAVRAYNQAVRSDFVGTRAAVEQLSGDVADATRGFIASGDAIFKWSEALASTKLPKLPDFSRPPGGVSDEGGFLGGFKAGLIEIGGTAKTNFQIAKSAAESFATSLSDGLGSAITNVISGTESFGRAFRNVAGNVLKQIGTMIVSATIFRGIFGGTGLLASLFGGGGATAAVSSYTSIAGSAQAAALAAAGGVPGYAGFNLGGIPLGGSRVQRFATGGVAGMLGMMPAIAGVAITPGPSVNRDIVPALLTPGEPVLRAASLGPPGNLAALAHANRGGAIEPAGAGGGAVVISPTIHVHLGPGATPEQGAVAGQAAARQVLAVLKNAIDSSPAFQEYLRRTAR